MAAERSYPRFRPDLVVRRTVEAGEAAWTVHDPLRNTYYRHDVLTHEVCALLDGVRGPAAMQKELEKVYPQFDFPEEWIAELVGELRRGGFLEDTFRMNEMQRARAQEARRRFSSDSLKNIFNIQFAVVDPTRAFRLVYPVARVLFTPWFVFCAVIAFLAACGLVWDRRDALVGGMAAIFTLKDSGWLGLAFLWVVLFGIVVAHEFGHGLCCKHFGGQPRRLGFMLFYLMPGMFCDVSDIYFFERRWHRVAVALAGGYVELLVFTLGTFVWVLTPPDLFLHDVAFRVLLFSGTTGLIFNYNPLIKLDGYYVLLSLLDIPDLRERAFKYVSDLFQLHVLRMPVRPEKLTRYERRAFLIYGGCALLYSLFYSVVVLLFMRNVLVGNFREAGFVVFVLLFAYTTRKLWGRLFTGARYLALERGGFARRHVALLTGALALLVLAVLVPLPHRVHVQAVLDAADRRTVIAPFDGRVEDVLVTGGTNVGRGAVLAVVRKDGDAADRARARAEALRGEATARHALGGPAEDDARAALPGLRARLAEASGAEFDGFLSADLPGRVLALEPAAWVGRHVLAGDSLFDVGRSDSLDVLLVASERDAGDLGLGRRADVRLFADPGRRLACVVTGIDATPLEGAPLPSATASLVDAERSARRFVARARVANEGDLLRPGMSGLARVDARPLSLLQRAARFYARIVRADFWL
jgi:putative peptide zinc metalloprotease protein